MGYICCAHPFLLVPGEGGAFFLLRRSILHEEYAGGAVVSQVRVGSGTQQTCGGVHLHLPSTIAA